MKTLAAALLCTTGCLVTTGTTTTMRKVGVENGSSAPGKIDHITLAAAVADRTVTIRAVASRTCTRPINNVFEVRTSEHLRMGGAEDARARAFGAVLAPVTLPVSLIVAGLSMGPDQVTKQSKLDHTEQIACTTPADALPLAIELPSGARETATTDTRGELFYTIPLAEPYAGTIVVRSGDIAREVAYHQPLPALVEAREALTSCGAGAATLALQVGVSGLVTHAWVADDDGAVARCVEKRLARTAMPFHDETIELPFGATHVVDTARRIQTVCAVIDTGKDQLAEAEQARSRRVLARVLEEQNLLVVDSGCDVTYSLWHERTGGGLTVHLRNAAAARHTTVAAADVPAAYARLAGVLIEMAREASAPPAPAPHRDVFSEPERDPEPPAVAASPVSDSDDWGTSSLAYARIGIGSATMLAAGYRKRISAVALDASAAIGGGTNKTIGGVKGEVLIFTSEPHESSWYFGGGISFGGMQQASYNGTLESGGGASFEMTAGYEFSVGSTRAFFELDGTIPGYSLQDASGMTDSAPSTAIVSFGLGH